MLEHLKQYNIILASNSPRRQQLLASLEIDFTVVVNNDLKELYPEHVIMGKEIALYLAMYKANAYELTPDNLLIAADTVVVLSDNTVLGKPLNLDEAKEMLRKLSGTTHSVATGVCIRTREKQRSFLSISEVEFNILTEEEIEYYVNKYKPLDKAGAYGIQEWIGSIGVKNIKGSYFNIMGLPIQKLYEELKNFPKIIK